MEDITKTRNNIMTLVESLEQLGISEAIVRVTKREQIKLICAFLFKYGTLSDDPDILGGLEYTLGNQKIKITFLDERT